MPDNPLPASQSLQQPHKQIPEMELSDFIKLMKSHFGIGCEPSDRPYLVRFVDKPYNEEVESCRALSVTTHNKGTRLSPLNIKQILAKFEIPEKVFMEAYDLMMNKRVTPIRPDLKEAS